ncbi:MAG: ABC transporter permease, partial [Roseomonas sp.]|nr:ABC transporter permease [Roseomonas sp.]
MSAVLQPAGASNRRRIWRNAGAILGLGIVGFITFVAIFAPWLAPYDPFTIDLGRRVIPPMWMEGGTPANILGTDQLGRDYLSRLIYGARVSMIIGVATIITSGIIGTFLGVIGGFYGGRIDD